MKRVTVLLMIVFLAMGAGKLFAQKLESGSLADLKGQSVINIQYDYSDLMVGKKTEKEYVDDGIEQRNKKKPGSGDEWAKAWVNDRATRYQPTFEKNFNGVTDKAGITGKEGASDAKYTFIIHTTFVEPGFQSGVGPSKPAYINLVIKLVETADPSKVLATIKYDKVPSANMMGYDFDTGARIQSCFDRAGGNVGALIVKNLN